MNVASLAGLPESLVARARSMADSFEARLEAAHKTGRSTPSSDLVYF
jgi:DNA mismatch repair ATPase MutS